MFLNFIKAVDGATSDKFNNNCCYCAIQKRKREKEMLNNDVLVLVTRVIHKCN